MTDRVLTWKQGSVGMSILTGNYLGIPGYVLFWSLAAVALGFFIQRVYLLIALLKLGRPEPPFNRLAYRIRTMLGAALTQSTNLKTFSFRDPASLGHALMFWGLILFGLAYFIFLGLGTGLGLFSVYRGSLFEVVCWSVLDIVALMVILSILWVIIKRYIIKPERLERKQSGEEKVTQALLLMVIISLMLLHYGITGFGYAANGISPGWAPISAALAGFLVNANVSPNTLDVVFKSLWWLNYILILGAVIYAPRSKHLHPLTSFFNMALKNLGPKGSLKPVDLSLPHHAGAAKIQDFSRKQLLDLYACTWCGKCHIVCPAQLSGKTLSPRELILGLKENLFKAGPALLKAKKTGMPEIPPASVKPQPDQSHSNIGTDLIGSVISEEAVWSCTTCLACQEVCPVNIEHIDKIVDLRRYQQMVKTTETARDSLKNLRVRGNPWRGTTYARTDWAEGMDIQIVGVDNNIDVLFWVGCTEALEDRSLKVAQSMARVMKQAGINFGILGEEEMCCGDPARRLGADHIFQMLAANNIQLLQSYNIKKIVTACPHCFNTIKNEYPRLGGQFEVIHHSQFIADLIKQEKLNISRTNEAVITYQDPCYLGRYNAVYEAPRQILKSISGLTLREMDRSRENGFCCGGGGGRMWLEEKSGERISEMRLAQAVKTDARMMVTACPFCLQMFEDAAKAKEVGESLEIKDIAEIVDELLDIRSEGAKSGSNENTG